MTEPDQHSLRGTHDPWIVAVLVGLPWLYWVAKCGAVYLQVPLPRDPMIFQYTAWAVRQGDVLYRDVLDVNGPLITWIHLAFQALGGETARGLRWLDLAASTAVFAIVGATLPRVVSRRDASGAVPIGRRVAWAFTTAIVLLAAYFSFNFWDTAQREGLYFLCVLLSIAIQTEALARRSAALLCLAGVLSGVTWLGKPTFVLFSLLQTLPLWRDGEPGSRRGRMLWWFALSTSLGALGLGLISMTIADMPRWLQLLWHDVPAVYRHVHARTFSALWEGLRGGIALLAIVQSAAWTVCARRRLLPTSALVPGLLPLPAIANIALQSKGYFYHYEPLWLALGLQWLLLVAAAWTWLRDSANTTRGAAIAVTMLTLIISGVIGLNLSVSSYLRLDSLITAGHPAADDEHLRLKLFSQRDSMLLDERIAADYLAQTTTPEQRVQVFGMDPSLLFLARRLSATPYIYSFDLVLDDTLNGAQLRGAEPADTRAIIAIGDARIADFTRRLAHARPAKIVFPAHADFLPDTPEATFRARLPDAARWLDASYRLEANIGTFRVYGLSASPDAR